MVSTSSNPSPHGPNPNPIRVQFEVRVIVGRVLKYGLMGMGTCSSIANIEIGWGTAINDQLIGRALQKRRQLVYRVGQKPGLQKSVTPVYDDIERRSIYQNVEFFIGV